MTGITRTEGKRGRPSKAEEGAITIAILNAGLRLFLQDGYGATSMKRVGEEAGVAPNTLYGRFPDKPALFKAIVGWKAAMWKVTSPARHAPAGASLKEVVRVAVLAMLEAMEREDISAMGRLLILEASRFPELSTIYYEGAARIGEEGLITSIKTAGLSEKDAANLSQTLLECAAGHMNLRHFRSADYTESNEKAAERISAMFSLSSDTKTL